MTAATIPVPTTRAARTGLGTLLRSELNWIFRRPRTLVVLGLLAAVPVIIGVSVRLATGGGPSGSSDAPAFVTAPTSALALSIGSFTVLIGFLLPLASSMAAADALAGEQANGTLRGWLLAPVARGRLLAVKALGVAAVTLAASGAVAVTGLATGLALNGTGGLITLSGTTVSVADALLRIVMAALWTSLLLMAIGAVALAISAGTEHPMLVVVSVIGGLMVAQVLLAFSALDWLHPFLLPNEAMTALTGLLRDPVATDELATGALRAACYLVIGLSLAYARLVSRDG